MRRTASSLSTRATTLGRRRTRGFQFRGRTATLKRNYRSTAEIDRAAFSLLRPEEAEALEPSTSIREGPMPVLVRGVRPEKEPEWIARFVRQLSKHLHLRAERGGRAGANGGDR